MKYTELGDVSKMKLIMITTRTLVMFSSLFILFVTAAFMFNLFDKSSHWNLVDRLCDKEGKSSLLPLALFSCSLGFLDALCNLTMITIFIVTIPSLGSRWTSSMNTIV